MKKIFTLVCLLQALIAATAAPGPGSGWKIETVSDGLIYYSFSGMDEITGAAQQVFAVDLDLSNPRYAFRFSYSSPDVPTSDVFLRNKALAAMNAGYEASSIVVKVNGDMRSNMPYNTVFLFPVENWKSEGAVYTDGLRNVRIASDGKGRSLKEKRRFFASSSWRNIFTSAPMLIDDFVPVGAWFVDSTLTAEQLGKYHYEHPFRHQGVRHPRTAVAKTADNHVILIAVDGRRPGIGEGMNAREFTRFLQKWFNPRYALNMDGGGSTTLCVRGHGDPVTNVVNYPNDNKKYDHAGERLRDTHFYIVELKDRQPLEPTAPLDLTVGEKVRADRSLAAGLDRLFDFSPKVSTPAPKGYEPVYISHYGRHGSRYAYTAKTYSVPLEMLRNASEKDNLTEYGKKLLSQLEAFWKNGQYKVGDLTPLGWEQHRRIAKNMVRAFPSAFKAGSRVDACSSAAVRSVISMSSCCASLAKEAPGADIYAHQSTMDAPAARPNLGVNPFRYKGADLIFPYPESTDEFFARKLPGYDAILARLFKNTEGVLGDRSACSALNYLYMLDAGMASIPEEERMDTEGLFTDEEFATLWEVDNYDRFRVFQPYQLSCCSIVDDIIAKADKRLQDKERGADLRFGHDHVVMPLLMIMDINGMAYVPKGADDLKQSFRSFLSPMAANIQLVFFAPRKGKTGDVLVKVLLNEEEARLGSLKPVQGPYYKWTDVREYLKKRVSSYVD